MKIRIAIFASGSGSNAQKLMEYFKRSTEAEISLVLTNNSDAYVLQRADNFEIPSHVFDKNEFYRTDDVIDLLKNLDIDLIVLAGFLWLIPKNLIAEYPGRIISSKLPNQEAFPLKYKQSKPHQTEKYEKKCVEFYVLQSLLSNALHPKENIFFYFYLKQKFLLILQ